MEVTQQTDGNLVFYPYGINDISYSWGSGFYGSAYYGTFTFQNPGGTLQQWQASSNAIYSIIWQAANGVFPSPFASCGLIFTSKCFSCTINLEDIQCLDGNEQLVFCASIDGVNCANALEPEASYFITDSESLICNNSIVNGQIPFERMDSCVSLWNSAILCTPPSNLPCPVDNPNPFVEFLGFYADCSYSGIGALSLSLLTDGNLTVETCQDLAAAGEYTLFGLQSGSQCWGGTSLAQATALGPDTASSFFSCSGNATEICGGSCMNALYSLSPSYILPAPQSDSLGCFADICGAERSMSYHAADSTEMTTELCSSLAVTLGFTYFGLQDGNQCFLSNSYSETTGAGIAPGCYTSCLGNADEVSFFFEWRVKMNLCKIFLCR